MSLCPEFWCSKCKFSHAGECITSNPCAETCLTCPAGFCQGHSQTTAAECGKWYMVERLMPTGKWMRDINVRWMVTKIETHIDRVELMSDGGSSGSAKLATFTDAGNSAAAFGYVWRMVPAP